MAKVAIIALATFTAWTGSQMIVCNAGEIDPDTDKPREILLEESMAAQYVEAKQAKYADEESEDVDLANLTKNQLVAFAEGVGITVDPAAKKADILTVIEEALLAQRADGADGAGDNADNTAGDNGEQPPV